MLEWTAAGESEEQTLPSVISTAQLEKSSACITHVITSVPPLKARMMCNHYVR
jgi:hypothetical protein